LSKTSKILFVIGALLLIAIFLGVLGYFSGYFYFSKTFECAAPPWVQTDGYVKTDFYVWYDKNANAIQDEGEPAFRGVTVHLGNEMGRTSQKGTAEMWLFRPNCVCRCWEGVKAWIDLPQGYRATTPLEVMLSEADQLVTFGLTRAP
jgi:hypothetical protein